MKEKLKIIFALAAVLAGIAAIIIILGNAEVIITFMSLTFGVMAIIWTIMAYSSLSPGSSLRSYTGYFLACLILILVSSVWNGIVGLLKIGGAWKYLGYFFITSAYLVFVAAAYKIYYLGREFGFQKQAGRIKEAMKRRG
ncbi:hypothetical protein COV19_05015 [Candidatus Woesearchaeota archaeon CG10_big_fil_rev_8_21_14_0_10_44_13]|nr:MAG: hypothetical protein COV19_05015 [Candidatus Woesearchaeota archaeon CG10_big_fil_rev_8_21_14_0_10_44_13]